MVIYQVIFWISLTLIICVYFFYPIVLAVISIFYRKPIIKDDKEEYFPGVSFIMAAYNEEAHIERKIKNCLSLDYPANKLEIIIGSDGSDDRTNEIVQNYVKKGISVFLHPIRRGKMAVINDAVRNAKGEICIFTDVSELFDRDALKKLVRNFVDSIIGAVTGHHIFNPSKTEIGKGTHLYWRYQRWIQGTESRLSTILSCDGTIYACRRHLFVPPPEGTINDDKAVPLGVVQQGYRVIFEPEAVARGDVLPQTKAFFRQKVRGQAGMYQILWLSRSMFWPKKPMIWFTFMSHTVGPVMVPWLLLVLLLSNLALCLTYPYNLIFLCQFIFYISSGIGAVLIVQSYLFLLAIYLICSKCKRPSGLKWNSYLAPHTNLWVN